MDRFELPTLEVKPHFPEVLHSADEGRAIVLHLPAGEELQEHEVHERTYLVVVSGEVEVAQPGAAPFAAGPGTLLVFDPHEGREVRAAAGVDARMLMVFAPWPAPSRRA